MRYAPKNDFEVLRLAAICQIRKAAEAPLIGLFAPRVQEEEFPPPVAIHSSHDASVCGKFQYRSAALRCYTVIFRRLEKRLIRRTSAQSKTDGGKGGIRPR
jgi:hypothetical protein